MTTTTAAAPSHTTGSPGRVMALAMTEARLLLRNKTIAVTAAVLPLVFGIYFAFILGGDGDPRAHGVVLAMQIASVIALGIYSSITLVVVGRRHSGVLKRMRTSAISDSGILAAIAVPALILGALQLVVLAVFNTFVRNSPLPVDVLPLVLAVVGGLVLVAAVAFATAVVTPTPERASITTLPMIFLILGACVLAAVFPTTGWWQALVAAPGGAIGQLVQLSMSGEAFEPGFAGIPVLLPSVLALVVWPVLFGMFARSRFNWDPKR